MAFTKFDKKSNYLNLQFYVNLQFMPSQHQKEEGKKEFPTH